MVHSNNSVFIIPEGGVSEAGRTTLANFGPGEDSQWRVEGRPLLGNGVVAGAVEVIHLVVKGEDVHVTMEVTVTAWRRARRTSSTHRNFRGKLQQKYNTFIKV